MVERYNSSTAVQTAQVAKPDGQGMAQLAGAVRNLAQTAQGEAQRRLEERDAALESAALNNAQLELAKRGSQIAADLQANRVAGSDYVKDLEAARKTLKQDIWGTLPGRVQNSTRAKMAWDETFTSDEISATRMATAWQMDQEKKYAANSLDNRMLALSAAAEADPDHVAQHLERWNKSIPTLAGLLDPATREKAQVDGAQVLMQGAVRGLAKQGRFDEARKLVTDAAKGLDPQQRKAFESFIKDAENDIEQEKAKQEVEQNKAWRVAGNEYEVAILDGKGSRKEIDEGVKAGRFSPNDQPALIRMLREEQDRRKREAAAATTLTDSQKAAWADQSATWKNTLFSPSAMSADVFMGDRSQWSQGHQAMFAAMTPDDQRAVENERTKLKDGRGTYDNVKKINTPLMDVAQRVADPSWGLNLTPTERKKDPQAAARADKLVGEIWAQASTLSQLNSERPLTPDQINQAVAVALKKAGETKSDFMDWQLFAREVDPDGRQSMAAPEKRAEDMRRYDMAEYQQTFAELKAAGKGVDPSPDEVAELMMRRREGGRKK